MHPLLLETIDKHVKQFEIEEIETVVIEEVDWGRGALNMAA